MNELITVLVLGILTVLSVSLLKTYNQIPLKELRRQARRGNKFSDSAYRVAAYGLSAEIFFWFLISIFGAWLFIELSQALTWWQAFISVIIIIWIAFWWVPIREINRFNQRLAIICAPVLARILSLLSPILIRLEKFFAKTTNVHIHTGIYEKEDLLELLDRQTNQVDSRLSDNELEIARSALSFGDKLVRDVMTPKRMMTTIYAEDAISPHIMDELHGKGFSRLPVYEKTDDSEKVVGILYIKDLLNNLSAGRISDVMDRKVFYVQEQRALEHVLEAFLKTKHHLFVIVNNFEEVVGVISIEDVLEQIIGTKIVDEFDKYDDLRAVAELEAKKERKRAKHEHQAEQPEQTAEQTDEKVVE
jgi:CBS domain containing-hemolysin-like protein